MLDARRRDRTGSRPRSAPQARTRGSEDDRPRCTPERARHRRCAGPRRSPMPCGVIVRPAIARNWADPRSVEGRRVETDAIDGVADAGLGEHLRRRVMQMHDRECARAGAPTWAGRGHAASDEVDGCGESWARASRRAGATRCPRDGLRRPAAGRTRGSPMPRPRSSTDTSDGKINKTTTIAMAPAMAPG